MEPVLADSARTHYEGDRISDDDVLHAFRNPIKRHDLDDRLVMLVGSDRTGRLLEVGVRLDRDPPTIVHAMPARAKFL